MRSLKSKLVLWILPLCLLPLMGISVFSYFVAKERITEDRIVLYLQQIARDIADTLQLTILEKKEETVSMTLYGEFRDFLIGGRGESPELLLNKLVVVHEVYDLLLLFDVNGVLQASNTISRASMGGRVEFLDGERLRKLKGTNLLRLTPDADWLQQVRSRRIGYINWHRSPLVHELYDYSRQDICRHYSVGFAAPILDRRDVVVGGILALMNWEFIQEILDKVEEDLEGNSLRSGYAFLFGNDLNTIIGHKYRRHRQYPPANVLEVLPVRDNYGTRLVEDHGLQGLRQAVLEHAPYYRYQYPPGQWKISGLAAVNHEFFHWVCGVGIDDDDIFAPVQDLKWVLVWAASISMLLVFVLTYTVARGITIPIKKLTQGVRVIAGGDLSQRVEVATRDEIGELARTFNEMAQSLQERSQALIELNRLLEEKVQERTQELERTTREVQKAYQELKETQVQLVQSEKMASLGQLVAGIAHEIKNPLNFIYGNTDFLRDYTGKLRQLVERYEKLAQLDPEAEQALAEFKRSIHYEFLLQDLDTLIHNLEEGARRIHSIIGDLRTFSRMDQDEFRRVDIHEPIELALNLLQNEYRDRIRIHKDFQELPKLEIQPGKMSQVFMNLLANACQAIPDQGEIWIRTRREDGVALIEIEDNGEGIEEEHLEKIFEPFFTTKAVGKGTGLGLSISYGIIRQHNGTIQASSQKGKGTRFQIRLPWTHERNP